MSTTAADIRQFRDAVAGVLSSGDDAALPSPDADWRAGWPTVARLGVTGLCVAEDRDGLGMQAAVATGAAMEFGAALHGSPYAGLVAAGHALGRAGTADDVAGALLAEVLAGTSICAYGRTEPDASLARAIDGAQLADALVLEDLAAGDLMVLTDRSAWTPAPLLHSFDVTREGADVTFDPARAHRIPARQTSRNLFALLLAADALGGVACALRRTVAYAKDRQAFGRPIGGFQAVQHRLADHAVRLRGMDLVVAEAARAIEADSPHARRAVAIAEASVGSGAGPLLHDLLQLTGAIGFTWEYGLHLYQRRAHHDARLAANPRQAHQVLAELEGWTDGG